MEEKKYNILVIEDNSDVRGLLATKIKLEGWNCTEAYDGQDGIEKLKENRPDLILLDIMMPRIDGYDVCFMIKNNKNYADIPIIILSAKNNPHEQIKGKMSGANEYIGKPFDIEEVINTIKKYLP